jgi:hypothetical protein
MAVQVIEQVAQTVVAQGNAPFLGPLALDDNGAMLAVKVLQAQIT